MEFITWAECTVVSGLVSSLSFIIGVVSHCALGYSSLSAARFWQSLPKGLGSGKYKAKSSFALRCAWVEADRVRPATLIHRASMVPYTPLLFKTFFFRPANKVSRATLPKGCNIWGSFCILEVYLQDCISLQFVFASQILQKSSFSLYPWSYPTLGDDTFIYDSLCLWSILHFLNINSDVMSRHTETFS